MIKLVPVARNFMMNGSRIGRIEHEADIVKFQAVEEHGGLVLDFDVFIVNGEGIREWMTENPCVICHEGHEVIGENNKPRVNAGFFGCLREHARFPQLILEESYAENFRPNEWMYNSGIKPLEILEDHPETAVLVENVCNNPAWLNKDDFNLRRGRYSWTDRKAYHSYFHDSSFSTRDLVKLNSTLGDMLRWIMSGGPPQVFGNSVNTSVHSSVIVQDLVF